MLWQSSFLLLYEVSLGGNLYNGLTSNWSIVNVGDKYDNFGYQLAQCDRQQNLQTYTPLLGDYKLIWILLLLLLYKVILGNGLFNELNSH